MHLAPGERLEPIGGGSRVIVSPAHTFSTDTVLLANWSMPRPGDRCAELGTGCGMAALLWCTRSAPDAVYAIDNQPQACSQAARSAALNGFANLHVLSYDLREIPAQRASALPMPIELDVVACNPPYTPLGAGAPNPAAPKAAARHEQSCTLAEVAAAAARLLRWGGRFCCCLRPDRMPEAFATFTAAGLAPKRLRLVQHDLQKAPSLFLLECRRGGKPGLTIAPVLLLEDPPGTCSAEMRAIYGDYAEGHK